MLISKFNSSHFNYHMAIVLHTNDDDDDMRDYADAKVVKTRKHDNNHASHWKCYKGQWIRIKIQMWCYILCVYTKNITAESFLNIHLNLKIYIFKKKYCSAMYCHHHFLLSEIMVEVTRWNIWGDININWHLHKTMLPMWLRSI